MADAPVPVRQVQQPQNPQIPVEFQRAWEMVNDKWNDPVAGPILRKHAKEKYNIQTQDDAVEPIVAPLKKQLEDIQATLKEEREARAKEKAEAEEFKTKNSLEEAITAARKNYNLTDEGFDKMIARMKETGNFSDADAAAAWVVSKEPPPKPPGPSWAPKMIDMKGSLDAEMVKQLHSDPIGYQDAQLSEFLKDPDKYVQETLGTAA